MFGNYLKTRNKCQHKNINLFSKYKYCPDCGKLVHQKWYYCRCKCCGKKREAILIYDKIMTKNKYCKNCGSKEFIIEEVEDVNCVDLPYAVLKKDILDSESFWNKEFVQIWIAAAGGQEKYFLQTNGT